MKTIVISNQKGGVGKTAISLHLAWYMSEFLNQRVLLLDLDTQGNASFTLAGNEVFRSSDLFYANDISEKNLKNFADYSISLAYADPLLANIDQNNTNTMIANFNKNLKAIANNYDYCIIDTPPSLGTTLISALFSADYVASPVELETYSIQGISKQIKVINNVRKANKDLCFLGIIPSRVDNRNPRHKKHFGQLQEAFKDKFIDCKISLRSSIADSLSTSEPVWKNKKTSARKASEEMKDLCQFLFDNTKQ